MPTNQFPLLLKRERQLRGWSQQDVANALEIARVTVARWESGEAIPALYLRGPLCELFGRRIEEFFPIDAIDSTITHPHIIRLMSFNLFTFPSTKPLF